MACFFCQAPVAPFGYRKPGPYSQQAKRGYLWACADHRADAEARLAAAIGAIPARPSDPGLQPRAKGNRQIHADPPDTAQGTLI